MSKTAVTVGGVIALFAGYAAGSWLGQKSSVAIDHADTAPAAICAPDRSAEHLRFDFTPLADIEAMALAREPASETVEITAQ